MGDLIYLIAAVLCGVTFFIGAYYVSKILLDKFNTVSSGAEREKVDVGGPTARPPILDNFYYIFKGKMPKSMYNKAEQMIQYAGNPMDLKGEDMLTMMLGGLIGGFLMGLFVCFSLKQNYLLSVPLALFFAGYPWLWLRDKVLKRHAQIVRDLPFNIDLLTLSVEAGLDFSAGVAKMVDKGKPGPVRDEFKIMLSQMRMGKSRAEAMQEMAVRVGLPSFNSFLQVLIQADRLGSGMGKVLRIQAEQMRLERSQRAEKKAAEAPVKMLLPLVCFIFPTIFIILAGPMIYQFFIQK